jgi:cyclic pyranopterin phosphate synthase
MKKLTHLDSEGNAQMVEVGEKPISSRRARSEGFIFMNAETLAAIRTDRLPKGDVLTIAQLAGIQAAKRASEMIPLCHPIPLSGVEVMLNVEPKGVRVSATVTAQWRTGVEMESLTAVSAALLTLYDMVKSIDRSMEIGQIRLLEKRGGRSGVWIRAIDED